MVADSADREPAEADCPSVGQSLGPSDFLDHSHGPEVAEVVADFADREPADFRDHSHVPAEVAGFAGRERAGLGSQASAVEACSALELVQIVSVEAEEADCPFSSSLDHPVRRQAQETTRAREQLSILMIFSW